jgi:tetratricopeptide (TPR) repeat protein
MQAFCRYVFLLGILFMTACQNTQDDSGDQLVPLPKFTDSELNEKIKYLSEIIKEYPKEAEYHARRAELYLEAKKERLALMDIDKAVQLDSNRADYYFTQAQIYDIQAQYVEALKSAEKAQLKGYQDAQLTVLLGKLYSLNSQAEKAIQYLKNAEKIFPSMPDIYFYEGLAYARLKDTVNTVEVMQKALAYKPKYIEAYRTMVDLFLVLGKYRRALSYGIEGLQKCGDDAYLHFKCGKIYEAAQRKSNAAAHYEQAIKLDSAQWQAAYQLYYYYQEQEQYSLAGRYLEIALRTQNDIPYGHFYLAYLCETKLRSYEKALAHYQKAAQLDTANPWVAPAILRVQKRLEYEAFKKTDEFKEMIRRKQLEEQKAKEQPQTEEKVEQ